MHDISRLNLPKQKEKQFQTKGICTIEALASYFPRKYIDFRTILPVASVKPDTYCTIQGCFIGYRQYKTSRTAMYSAYFKEEKTKTPFYAVWFGTDFYVKQLIPGEVYTLCGKSSEYNGILQLAPLACSRKPREVAKIFPVYSKIKGMSDEYLKKSIDAAISFLRGSERKGIRDVLAKELGLDDRFHAFREIHNPDSENAITRAKERLDFDDIYEFYAELKDKEEYRIGVGLGNISSISKMQNTIDSLLYTLTPDQKNAIDAIVQEASSGQRIHALISGDVGCGKTVIAVLATVLMQENGYQSIVMAPTLVLAEQHFEEFSRIAGDMRIALLTTETKAAARRKILAEFANGSIDVLIGTHSVLSEEVVAHRLGLTVIDEEHKFGVAQKARLQDYDKAGIHHISMTATPIPRSIAMTVYGNELAVLPIRTKPVGRKPVITEYCATPEDAFEKILEEIRGGHQGYIVCPFIEDSETERFADVLSVAAVTDLAKKFFPQNIRIGIVSGDMSPSEVKDTVKEFANHDLDVLISTTIIEVGINVPNATVMAVMSAERFGLAGLHQLRGRVGRGNAQSYCLLCAQEKTERIEILCNTNDGFEVAEYDLKMRGPGDLTGVAQSGESEIVEKILRHPQLAKKIRERVFAT